MRLGVLDIGSNTGHLLVVDAHRGAAPLPAYSHKSELRLAEHIGSDGALARVGVNALISFIGDALDAAEDKGCESVTAFATSAVRDASNVDGVVDKVRVKTGVDLRIMSGSEEAKLTF
jgi:exopolyphosphatase/guanosine-5'-triphosphate,3'-diphosphate pyrophosphatase